MNYKIKVTPEQSQKIQNICFGMDIEWIIGKKISNIDSPCLYIHDKRLMHGGSLYGFEESEEKKISATAFIKKYENKYKPGKGTAIRDYSGLSKSIYTATNSKIEGGVLTIEIMRQAVDQLRKETFESMGIPFSGLLTNAIGRGDYVLIDNTDLSCGWEEKLFWAVVVEHNDRNPTVVPINGKKYSLYHNQYRESNKTYVPCVEQILQIIKFQDIINKKERSSMQELTAKQKKALPKVLQPLLRAGWINPDLSPTSRGESSLMELLMELNEAAMSAKAVAHIKKEEAEDK